MAYAKNRNECPMSSLGITDPACITPANTSPGDTEGSPVEGLLTMVIDHLKAETGHRILHIGPDHHLALLAAHVGPTGSVTATTSGKAAIDRGDYDRIVFTTEQWDLSPAWGQSLTRGGRLVVPLRLRGATYVIVFKRDGGFLRSTASRFYAATPLDVVDQHGRRRRYGDRCDVLNLCGERPVLMWESDQRIKPEQLRRSLQLDLRDQRWTGVTVHHGDDLGTLWLQLAARELGTCGLAGGTGTSIAPMAIPEGTPAIAEDSNLAYLTRREQPSEDPSSTKRFELGVTAFGPYADTLGERFAIHIAKWSKASRRPPYITAYPQRITKSKPRTPAIDRRNVRIVITC
ncbi:hypothetical protein ACIQUM_36400 [Amycolatopsis azurea]|uniref:hypothetical protein n=1 Tax=Amycolatopsis azurea TaxID=36819 RepID=UPI003820A303